MRNNRKFRVLAAVFSCALASPFALQPAHATGGVACKADGRDDVFINIAMGRLPVLSVVGMRAGAGTETFAMDDVQGSQRVSFGQGLIESDRFAADFTDPNVERIVVSLRIRMAEDGHAPYQGELRFNDAAPITVDCDFE